MTKDDFNKIFEDTVEQIRNTLLNKGQDYTSGAGTDRLSNFKLPEILGIAKAEQGLLCRMLDKISRIISFLNTGKLAVAESADDAIMDLIGYGFLLRALLRERNDDRFKVKE